MMIGGSTKPELYCRITTYLQHNANTLYDNLNDLCLFGAFNTRGGRGVTFLLPDKKTQKKIDSLVGTDARKAVAMINALILPVYLGGLDDFESNKDDIPNKLGNKLPIKSITGSACILDNGAKITIDPGFNALYDNTRMNIFKIDGEVPITGEASQALSKKGRGFRGGRESKCDRLEKLFYEMKGKTKGFIKYGRANEVDPLTCCLAGLSDTPLLIATNNGSPLQVPFLLGVLKNNEHESVPSSEVKGKLQSLFSQGDSKILADEKKVRASDIQNLNIGNIRDHIKQRYTACWNTCSSDIQNLFTNKASFVNWCMAKDEFCLIYTNKYINAVYDKKKGEVLEIFHNLNNVVLGGLIEGKYNKCLHLTGTEINPDTRWFCKMLDMYTNSMSFSINNVSSIMNDNTFIVDYTRPDNLNFSKLQLKNYNDRLKNVGANFA